MNKITKQKLSIIESILIHYVEQYGFLFKERAPEGRRISILSGLIVLYFYPRDEDILDDPESFGYITDGVVYPNHEPVDNKLYVQSYRHNNTKHYVWNGGFVANSTKELIEFLHEHYR